MREDTAGTSVGPGASHGAIWDATTAGYFISESTDFGGAGTWDNRLRPINYDRDPNPDFVFFYPEVASPDLLTIRELTPEPPGGVPWAAPAVHTYTTCVDASALLLGDLDGDGVSDIIEYCDGVSPTWQYRLHTGAYGNYGAAVVVPFAGDPSTVRVLDFDGDGRHELLTPSGTHYARRSLDSGGGFTRYETNIPVEYPAIFLDANGDGLVDVVTLEPPESGSRANVPMLRLNVGGTLRDPVPALTADADEWIWHRPDYYPHGTYARVASDVRVADLNADGRDDFVAMFDLDFTAPNGVEPPTEHCSPSVAGRCIQEDEAGLMLAHISAGDEFHTIRFGHAGFRGPTSGHTNWPQTQIIDLGADGLPDFVFAKPQYNDPDPPERWGALDLHVRQNRFRIVPGLMVRAYQGAQAGHDMPTPLAEFSYQHVSLPDGECAFPVRCAVDGVHVVRAHHDALGRLHQHWYRGPRVDLRSGESLGFSRHYVVDESTGVVTETRYDNSTDVPGAGIAYAGLPDQRITYAPVTNTQGPAYLLRDEDFEYQVTPLSSVHHAVQLKYRNVYTYELATVLGGCVPVAAQLGCDGNCRECSPIREPDNPSIALTNHVSSVFYDAHGSVEAVQENTAFVQTDVTHFTLENRPLDWLIGLRRRVESSSTSVTTDTRVSTHEYDARGFPVRSIVEPDDPGAMLEIVRTPDPFGHAYTVTESASGLIPRTTTFYYDPDEQIHPYARENAKGHVEVVAMHPGLGVPVLFLDANGVETRMKYDGFGRPRSSYREGSEDAVASVRYFDCATSAACVTVDSETAGHSHVRQDIDSLGRTLISRELLPDGWVSTDLVYDAVGRVHEVVGPRREGDREYLHRTIDHDAVGRPTRVQFHDSEPDVTFTYDGLTSTRIDRRGNPTVLVLDARGRVDRRTVYDNGAPITVDRTFGPFGSLHQTTASGATWTWDRDAYGRVDTFTDPDSGVHSYEYNAFGELTHEYAAGVLWTEIRDRDVLGRVVERWNTDDGTTTFQWDTATHAIGQLERMQSSDGVITKYVYDAYGRREHVSQTVSSGLTLTSSIRFDSYGRVSQIDYPESKSAGPLAVRYRYDPVEGTGRVAGVDLLSSSGWSLLWEAAAYDPLGRVRSDVLGNGLTEDQVFDPTTGSLSEMHVGAGLIKQRYFYDPNGSLVTRNDDSAGTLERFFYDDLNRLERWEPTFGPHVSYDYDALGNLVLNAGVVQRYGESGAGPHQLTSTAAGRSHPYDPHGRRVSSWTSGTLDWKVDKYHSSGLPAEIWIPTEGRIDLEYDATSARARRLSGTEDRTYLGQIYEQVDRGGVLSHVFHVYVEGRALAEVHEDATGARTTYYLHQDGLGSIVGVTDAAGLLVQRVRHDPFGERHATIASGAPTTPVSTRGFTFHEHEDATGWINMRGRIYDPTNGTFLTPDPLIRSTLSADALNPYEYVEGNPLTLTDPTGLYVGFGGAQGGGGGAGGGGLSGAASGLGGLIAGLISLLSNQGGGNHQGVGSAPGNGGGSSGHRSRRRAPPAVADVTGSSAGDTANSGAGVRQGAVAPIAAPRPGLPRADAPVDLLQTLAQSGRDYYAGYWSMVTSVPALELANLFLDEPLTAAHSDVALEALGWDDAIDRESTAYGAGWWNAFAGSNVLMAAVGPAAGSTAARAPAAAIGFTDDTVRSAFEGMRGGGGHAMRHLIKEGLIPDAGSLARRARQLEDLTTPILRTPAASFNWRVGDTAARAFAGTAGGRQVVVFVAKEGAYQGRVLSAIVPDAAQAAQWGL